MKNRKLIASLLIAIIISLCNPIMAYASGSTRCYIQQTYPFVGELAKIEFSQGFDDYFALIDRNGKAVFSQLVPSLTEYWGDWVSNNGDVFWYSIDDGDRDSNTNTYFRVDSSGKEYQLGEVAGEVVAYGDGTILTSENVKGFSENYYKLNIYDDTGALIESFEDICPSHKYVYLQNGIFSGRSTPAISGEKVNVIYNARTHSYYKLMLGEKWENLYRHLSHVVGFSGFYEDTYICELATYEPSRIYFPISINDFDSEESSRKWCNQCVNDFKRGDAITKASNFSEGYFYNRESNSFIDYQQTTSFTLPTYDNPIVQLDVGCVHSGSVYMILRGADKHHYITSVNTDGKVLHEPIKLPFSCDSIEEVYYLNDYIAICTDYYGVFLYDPSGTLTDTGVSGHVVTDEYIFGSRAVYNLDGSIAIDNIII